MTLIIGVHSTMHLVQTTMCVFVSVCVCVCVACMHVYVYMCGAVAINLDCWLVTLPGAVVARGFCPFQ